MESGQKIIMELLILSEVVILVACRDNFQSVVLVCSMHVGILCILITYMLILFVGYKAVNFKFGF